MEDKSIYFVDEKYDSRCDIYSFGMVLWEIINKKVPYSNLKSTEELVQKVGREGHRPEVLSRLYPAATRKIQDLVEKCWSQNPENRSDFKSLVKYFQDSV